MNLAIIVKEKRRNPAFVTYCFLGPWSSRPGRPPKRTQSVTSPENSHIMPHSVPGLMSPGIIPPTGLNFTDPMIILHPNVNIIFKTLKV
ncbi:hypothetical protein Y1Q_0017219 [Alligator mississippiensis]|uniref:Uncharacterized protein n=1 Tax=Alligator mississippiensis TaxID=8496 RepID=A0A151NKR3_ALLMI|nr:hypothetical protein Y1Q_0017219 [Alligator mississippiensis]